MTLHRLRLFRAIAKHRSITKASSELHICQPSISHQLRLLQEQIGATLYTGGREGIELTEDGRAFLRDAEIILQQLDALNIKYRRNSSPEPAFPLRLGGSHGPATSVLPCTMNLFKKEHPAVEVELKAGSSPAMQDLVLGSQIDLAVITHPYPCSSLKMEPFREFELCVFVSPRHPLAKRREITLEELSRFPLVFGRPQKRHHRTDGLLSSMRAKGLNPNILMRCEWPDAVKAVVREGEAVGVLYYDVVAPAVNEGVFKTVKVRGLNLTVLSYIIYSKEKPLSQNAQEFLALLWTGSKKRTLMSHTAAGPSRS
ncbi:MAG: LysR family transcriptional regulator [Candidatus Binatia bacterium]